MTFVRPLPLVCLSIGLLAAGAVRCVAATDALGAQLAATCAACHRLDDHGTAIPPIAGLDAKRLGLMMQAFKSGERASHLMNAVSRSLSDQEIVAVARYLAAQGEGANSP